MKCIPNELTKNFKDPAIRRLLMKEYSDCRGFQGANEDGEEVFVSINSDSIVVTTFQKNGWTRENYYNAEGYPDGEAYTGKWDKPDPDEEVVYLVVENHYDESIVHVTAYKTHESALTYYRLLRKEFGNGNNIEEVKKDEEFHAFGVMTCKIEKKSIW